MNTPDWHRPHSKQVVSLPVPLWFQAVPPVVVYSVKPKMSHSVTPFSAQNGHPYFKPECEKKILMDRDIVVLSTQTYMGAWYLQFEFVSKKIYPCVRDNVDFYKRNKL